MKSPEGCTSPDKTEKEEKKNENNSLNATNSKNEEDSQFKDDIYIEISVPASEEKPENNNEEDINMTENKKQILNEFNSDFNFEKELKSIKETGKTDLEWKNLQNNFIEYYKKVVNEFPKEVNDSENNNPKDNIDEDIIEYLGSFTKIPFTLQRMAELILEPKLYYNKASKYNSAFKKLVNIDFE